MSDTFDIKICGLKTPEAVAAALEGGASHVGFIFFAKSPRNVDAARRSRARRGGARAGEDRRRHRRRRRRGARRPGRNAGAGRPAVARQRDAGARGRGEGALRPAGDEGVCGPRRPTISAASPPIAALPTGCSSMPSRRKVAELPGGNGVAFDWSLLAALDGKVDYMLSGGLNADNIGAALAASRARGDRRLLGRRKRAGRQGHRADRRLLRGRAGRAASRRPVSFRSLSSEPACQAQFLPRGSRRGRPIRHFRRPFRRRNADAADPRAAGRLDGGKDRSRRSRPSSKTSTRTIPAALARSISRSG